MCIYVNNDSDLEQCDDWGLTRVHEMRVRVGNWDDSGHGEGEEAV